jgi:uncharacterized repeat protein (TIGR03803 family)
VISAVCFTKKSFNEELFMKKLVSAAIFLLVLAVTVPSAQAQNFVALHEFNGATDGANPEGKLLRDAAGNLYGTTFSGGAHSEGTVFKIDNNGLETVLFSFDSFVSGSSPASALIQDQAGNLYGVADQGPGGAGVVFKISPQGEETILFAFQGCLLCHNPRVPRGGLLMDKSGNLYGTTLFGGTGTCRAGCGTIFRLDTAGKLHVLYSFTGGADGSQPFGPLVPDANGNLYGVAQAAGDLACSENSQAGCGTVFQLARNRKLTVLHTFHGGTDGAAPQPDLLLDTVGGNLYGATGRGGTSENGTLFKISSNGKYTVLHRFTGLDDGSRPDGGLVLDEAGNLFGAASAGGRGTDGTVFALNPAGRLKVLHTFNADLDGAFPLGGLIRDEVGHLFGTAVSNGLIQQRNGDVFEIRP